jgi:cytochrome c551/c552
METNFVVAAHTPRPIWVDQKTGAPVLPAQLDPSKAPTDHHGADLSNMLAAVYSHDELIPRHASDIHLTSNGHGGHGDAHRTADSHDDPKKPAHGGTSAAGTAAIPTTQATATTQPIAAAPKILEEPPADARPVPYFDPVTGATGRAVSQMGYWKRTHEPTAPRSFALVYHEWDWPMRPPKYLQANCVRCHNDVNSIKDEAPKVFEGRSLFINMGCINCHQMDTIPNDFAPKDPSDIRLIVANGQRKVGTDLRNVTSKLSPAFLNTWIWAPKAFRPSTKMPHFFMLENNSSDEELRRTRQEARAITEYIVRTASEYVRLDPSGQPVVDSNGAPIVGPLPPKHAIPPGGKGSPEAGKIVFNNIGCQGCHTNLNDDSGEKRNGKIVTLGEKWIVTDLTKGGELAREMMSAGGKAPDAKALGARAAELYDAMSYNERQIYLTEHLAPDYALTAPKYADGSPKPVFQHHGPELSGIGTKLTAGRSVDEARLWLYNWVIEPRHYSEYTVMPDLRLNPQQALDLTEYLLAQKRTNDKPNDDWKAELTPADTDKLIEMTSQFLRSRYSLKTSLAKADDDAELMALATDALATARVTPDEAKARAAKLNKDEKRLVFLGKKLISHYGCMNCHAINGTETMSSPCANLTDWGQKGLDKLDFGYLDHHKQESLPATSKIPMVNGVSENASHLVGAEWKAHFPNDQVAQAVDVAWPHVGHSRTEWLTQKLMNTRAYDRGKNLLEPDPKAPPDDLARRSGKPYDKLKMPTFYLNDREVDAIVTWVISNRDRLISHKLMTRTVNDQAKQMALGRHVAQKYNCVACHVIEHNAPSVQQFYKEDELTTKAPPSLRGEGNKIQHDWLFNFLKHVEDLRPLLYSAPASKPGIRMPSFPITDDEATALAAYFAAASQKEAKTLDKTLANIRKYIGVRHEAAMKPVSGRPANPTTMPAAAAKTMVESLINHAGALIADRDYAAATVTLTETQAIADAHKLSEPSGATTKPVSDRLKAAIGVLKTNQPPPQIPWPGDDWYTRPEFANASAMLKDWALSNKQITEIQLDPARNRPDEIARNMRTILVRSQFVRNLYDAPYPFVESPRPQISEARFKLGEKMFYEMQCLACHVLGDPNVPGAQKNPTAPNLTLTHRRLQPRWVRHWVQEPDVIQIKTAMPPFFTGRNIWEVHGQSWPRAQATARPADQVEAEYGKTVEAQTALLLDFLYAAGVRNYTGIQPAATAAPVAAAPSAAPAAPKVEPKAQAPKEAPKEPPKMEEKPAPKPATPAPTPAPAAAKPQAPAGPVSVKGVVSFDGKIPEIKDVDMSAVKECAAHHADPVPEEMIVVSDKNELKNVVVFVSGGLSGSFDPPAEAAVLDQKGCMYIPHVLPVMVGQKIDIKNSDAFLHNVHSMSNDNPSFNFGQPSPGVKSIDPLKATETFRVKCDVHPWMSAFVVAVDNPFFAVSGDDGSFSIANLPPGEYTLTAWHETLGKKEIPVKVEAGKPADVKLSFAAP